MSCVLRISKNAEPSCLASTRQNFLAVHGSITAGAWDDVRGPCKQHLREAAFEEQAGLCAYCMSPLSSTGPVDSSAPRNGGMKLEHFVARNADGSRSLDWDNILGVCPGVVVGREEAGGEFHCDTHRGHLEPTDQALSHSPASFPPDIASKLTYDARGNVRSDDPAVEADLRRLNLNTERLKRNRRAVIDALQRKLARNLTTAELNAELKRYAERDAGGRRRPYAGVAVSYLSRKLRFSQGG